MRLVPVFLAVFLSASAASAQTTSGVFAEYLYAHPDFEDVHVSMGDSLKGWLAGVDVSITNRLGVIARADGVYGDAFQQGLVIRPLGEQVRSALYTVTAGPRFSILSSPGSTIFVDGLVGIAHGQARNTGVDFLGVVEDTRFTGGAGGGLDVRLRPRIDLQLDVQYRRANLFGQALNVVHAGVGILFRPTRH